MKWFAEAPSNIALIKYMGKTNEAKNLPSNSSLSYTLPELLSFVEIETHHGDDDFWERLDTPGGQPFNLSESGQQRFLNHLKFLKQEFSYTGGLIVRSCNNFPTASGLASSASSFAALTLAAVRALSELTNTDEPSMDTIAELSRQGSGSSCRSLFSPWVLWDKNGVRAITDIPYQKLLSQAVIISHEEKEVPSSEAHRRIVTSHAFSQRPQRAEENLKSLLQSFTAKDWPTAFKIVWREFMDMHELFSTCEQPFTYMNDDTHKVLTRLEKYWEEHGDGPLVTMDAGPNIHLLYRPDQELAAAQLRREFIIDFDVL